MRDKRGGGKGGEEGKGWTQHTAHSTHTHHSHSTLNLLPLPSFAYLVPESLLSRVLFPPPLSYLTLIMITNNRNIMTILW